jgi:hypothetical protein
MNHLRILQYPERRRRNIPCGLVTTPPSGYHLLEQGHVLLISVTEKIWLCDLLHRLRIPRVSCYSWTK